MGSNLMSKFISDEDMMKLESNSSSQENQSSQTFISDDDMNLLEQKSPEKFTQLEAAGLGLASGAVPFDEQIIPGAQGAYEALTSKKALLDSYYEKQKAYKQAKETASEEYPGTYYGSAGAGALASALVPGAMLAKGASSASKASKLASNPLVQGAVSGAIGGISSGESEILKGDIENLPQEALLGAATGGSLSAIPGLAKSTFSLGKGLAKGTTNLTKDILSSPKYIETPFKYARQTGEKLTNVPLTSEGSDTLENLALDKFSDLRKKESQSLIDQTKQFREQADKAGLTSNLEESLQQINPENLSKSGKDLLLRAQGQDPNAYDARLSLLKKLEEQRLSGKPVDLEKFNVSDIQTGKFSGAVAKPDDELSRTYAKLGITRPGEVYDPTTMSTSQINKLKADLSSLPKEDKDLPAMKNLLQEVRKREHEMAGKMSPDYADLINKQQSSIEVEDLTGLSPRNISGATEEAKKASARDIARSTFQKSGQGSEQLSSEIKNIGSPELSKAYENLDIFKKAQATRKGLGNMSGTLGGSLTSLPAKMTSSLAGTVGKLAHKVDTSDDAIFKHIRNLRTKAGNTSNAASNLADKFEEISQKDPTTRARMIFSIMQQPAYQELLKNDVEDINEPNQQNE